MNLNRVIKRFNHIKWRALSIFLSIGFAAAYQNCGQVQFGKANAQKSLGLACGDTIVTTTKNLRIVFMVDNSDSTQTTDPRHYYRAQTLSNFLQDFGSKTNLTYAYGLFAPSATFYDPASQSFKENVVSPFGDANMLTAALNKFSTLSTQEWTVYGAAFSAIQSAILNDLNVQGNPKDFVVIFMSDGQPTDLSNPQTPKVVQLVQSLQQAVSTHGGNITVSSVYFGDSADATSISNMRAVASQGQGQFVDTNQSGGRLSIDDLINVPGQNCPQ